uniref:FISNA domain-containing protein n=1 Tax=Oreochromis aureus TaxID=47969 RepID=A0AAZ1XVX6_OREAU
MDQCEDREEGVPPSKSTLCGEHESQTKAQRLTEVHKKMMMEEEEDRAESGGSSCPSVRSDRSKGHNPNFSAEPGPTRGQRSQSAGSSCPSVRSDWSKHDPLDFTNEPGTTRLNAGERSRTRAGLQTASQSSCVQTDVGLQEVLDEHKISLRRRCERVTEGSDETGSRTLLNRIYTELYITEGQSEEVHTQHEVMQLETASKVDALHDAPIRCQDIFKALPDQQRPIRVVLTNGVAGVGKPSQCRSSLWTGQRAWRTNMSVWWFCFHSGS